MENWRAVPGYEGLYEVSDLGRIRSLTRVVLRKTGVLSRVVGKPMKQNTDKYGYKRINLSRSAAVKRAHVHRLVLMAFVGPSGGLQANHIDGNPKNNRVSNLEWCTPVQNMRHAKEVLKREMGIWKIRSADVPVIRADKRPQKLIASDYNVTVQTISNLKRRVTWSNIQ